MSKIIIMMLCLVSLNANAGYTKCIGQNKEDGGVHRVIIDTDALTINYNGDMHKVVGLDSEILPSGEKYFYFFSEEYKNANGKKVRLKYTYFSKSNTDWLVLFVNGKVDGTNQLSCAFYK